MRTLSKGRAIKLSSQFREETDEEKLLELYFNATLRGDHYCFQNSYPQLWFFRKSNDFTTNFEDPSIVGDIDEMKVIADIVKMEWSEKAKFSRKRKSNGLKARINKYWNIIDEKLKLKICKFVSVDYCVFDFTPPSICSTMVGKVCDAVEKYEISLYTHPRSEDQN